jgi:hypothetical protein
VPGQIRTFYDLLGDPEEVWPEVKQFKNWEDLKPKKIYEKTLGQFIKSKNPDADQTAIDL